MRHVEDALAWFCRPGRVLLVLLCLAPAALARSMSPAPEQVELDREALPTSQQVQVTVNLNHALGEYKPAYAWFGYDEANYTTTPNGGVLLRELHDLSPVPVSIRVHHLLTSGDGTPDLKWSSTGVYSEDASGKPVYHWRLLDGIFDAFQAAGVRPMVELGFMPSDLAAQLRDSTQPYQVRYPRSTVSGRSNNPPKDYARWGELARTVTAHLVQRYGRDTVKGWYFEVWNEPDIDYWHGSPQDYWKLYDFAAAGVRGALPEAKVGGPASTSPHNPKAYAFLQQFLEHVQSGQSAANGGPVPLDFISFHAKGQPKVIDGTVTMGLSTELQDADRGFALVASLQRFHHTPIILSEADPEGCAACSSKVNPANNYRNGTLYPAYTAAAYARLIQLADKYQVNLVGMLSWSFEFENREYFEGFRTLSTNGIDKPVLNFFRMAAKMSGSRVEATSTGALPLNTMVSSGVRGTYDRGVLATRSQDGAAVMLWNYQDAERALTGDPSDASDIALTLRGIPASVHRVRTTEYRIDEQHSNAYTLWKQMGSPQQPTAAQIASLQTAGGLQAFAPSQWHDVSRRTLVLHTILPRQSVSLITADWISRSPVSMQRRIQTSSSLRRPIPHRPSLQAGSRQQSLR